MAKASSQNKTTNRTLQWAGNFIFQKTEVPPEDLTVESLADIEFPKGPSFDGYWLQGVSAVWCKEGEIFVSYDGETGVTLKRGDFAVFYPDHMVTVDGLAAHNATTRMIITGRLVEESANAMGFYDCFHGHDPIPSASINFIREEIVRLKAQSADHFNHTNAFVLRLLYNLFAGIRERIRRNGSPLFYEAVRLFNADLDKGAIRVKQVAGILGVSTNTLHQAFVRHGFKSPGEFIAHRQMRLAQHLLIETRLPIRDVAHKCGFQTAAHFTTFIKKRTGALPKDIREPIR